MRHSKRALWIDYLSISQSDLQEKGLQVQMIGKIFFHARRVLAWVGEHSKGSEQLFKPWPMINKKSDGPTERLFRRFRTDDRVDRQEELRRAAIWAAFFERRYFMRTWIVQEIGNARQVIVHCGADAMDWKQLIGSRSRRFDAFYFDNLKLTRNGEKDAIWRLTSIWVHVHALECLMGDKRAFGTGHSSDASHNDSIFEYMERFKDFRCYDPRDQIHALRSLAKWPSDDQMLPVDYEARLQDVVITLYQLAYVNTSDPIKPLPGSKRIPSPNMLILVLRLSALQCEVVLQLLLDHALIETDADAKQRWADVGWLWKDEMQDFYSYWRSNGAPSWWSHPDPDHLDFDEADSEDESSGSI